MKKIRNTQAHDKDNFMLNISDDVLNSFKTVFL